MTDVERALATVAALEQRQQAEARDAARTAGAPQPKSREEQYAAALAGARSPWLTINLDDGTTR